MAMSKDVVVYSGGSEQAFVVFNQTAMPRSLQPFALRDALLMQSFETLFQSSRSLALMIKQTRQVMTEIKEKIHTILKIVQESEFGITKDFRAGLLLYVLSVVNQIPVSSFNGGYKATRSVMSVPCYQTFYKAIRRETIRLENRDLSTKRILDQKVAPLEQLTIELMVVDDEG